MQSKIKNMIYAALLIAISIIIPLYFGFLKVVIGPFTATIASHVPLFIAMLISPAVALAVGLGSALGFFITSPLVIAARALMHTVVGGVGGYLVKRNVPFKYVILITAPIHGTLEALAVIPFGFTVYKVLIVVGVGTIIHHFVDGAISVALAKALSKSSVLNLDNKKGTAA
ncbi:ECF transporter S component [Clostridium sp. 'White wine YQ']|uniref:ECF transporter S component n=1 Tax=Clostridium sp. 'White wine YQ' TaxID=3027474 RepID=UPI00236637BB|nr:ECF transporter S component [Clostridium sp. 'White wine YQ']MDD7793287.1 ECF transporter S component [Clostridium sp. 'White wine YQ']